MGAVFFFARGRKEIFWHSIESSAKRPYVDQLNAIGVAVAAEPGMSALDAARGPASYSCQQLARYDAKVLILRSLFHFLLALGRAEIRNLLSDVMEDAMASSDFEKQVSGYGLTTAQIQYRRPDQRRLLQSMKRTTPASS